MMMMNFTRAYTSGVLQPHYHCQRPTTSRPTNKQNGSCRTSGSFRQVPVFCSLPKSIINDSIDLATDLLHSCKFSAYLKDTCCKHEGSGSATSEKPAKDSADQENKSTEPHSRRNADRDCSLLTQPASAEAKPSRPAQKRQHCEDKQPATSNCNNKLQNDPATWVHSIHGLGVFKPGEISIKVKAGTVVVHVRHEQSRGPGPCISRLEMLRAVPLPENVDQQTLKCIMKPDGTLLFFGHCHPHGGVDSKSGNGNDQQYQPEEEKAQREDRRKKSEDRAFENQVTEKEAPEDETEVKEASENVAVEKETTEKNEHLELQTGEDVQHNITQMEVMESLTGNPSVIPELAFKSLAQLANESVNEKVLKLSVTTIKTDDDKDTEDCKQGADGERSEEKCRESMEEERRREDDAHAQEERREDYLHLEEGQTENEESETVADKGQAARTEPESETVAKEGQEVRTESEGMEPASDEWKEENNGPIVELPDDEDSSNEGETVHSFISQSSVPSDFDILNDLFEGCIESDHQSNNYHDQRGEHAEVKEVTREAAPPNKHQTDIREHAHPRSNSPDNHESPAHKHHDQQSTQSKGAFRVALPVMGYSPHDMHVKLRGHTLTFHTQRQAFLGDAPFTERLERVLELPAHLDTNTVHCQFQEDGYLIITALHKKEGEQIEVPVELVLQ